MTQSAMVRGLAKWVEKNMMKQLTAGGTARIGMGAFARLADTSPALAVQMALVKYPSLAPIVSTVKDAATFDAAWKALSGSVEDNGCLVYEVKEILPYPHVQVFRIKKADLDDMRAEMERVYKDELAAARAIEQAGQKAEVTA